MKRLKGFLLLAVSIVSIGLVGCSSTTEDVEKPKEEKEETTISLETLKEKDSVTFEELEQVAIKELGKGGENDKESNYFYYEEKDDTWYYKSEEREIVVTNDPILDFDEKVQKDDVAKIDYLSTYYNFTKAEFDEFLEGNITSESSYEDFNKLHRKLQEHIYSSYIEGQSSHAISTFLNVSSAIGREAKVINEIINMSRHTEDEDERNKNFKEMNDSRLETRKEFDTTIDSYVNYVHENVK